jgi:ssDNA-binding Zn-finger/Zn-ribbon topoisomerase 1
MEMITMSKEFVTLNTEQFVSWANEVFGEDNYNLTTPKRGRELVIRHDFKIEGLECHVYTTVEPSHDATRGVGEDAIRVQLFDRISSSIAHVEPKVLRVDGDTTVFDRLTQRVESVIKIAMTLQKADRFCQCKQNRAHTRKKTNTKTGETFLGCSLFPKCKNKVFDKLDNARTNYPLKFNPFADVTSLVSTLTVEAEQKLTVAMQAVYDIDSTRQTTQFKTWDVLEEADCVPTKTWPHIQYPFEYFNRVQSTCLKSNVWNRDVNLVLGTATSSGKTITAELVISEVLYGSQ